MDIDEKEENININNDGALENSSSKSINSSESDSRKFTLYSIFIKL